jgi:hypothetical protein
MLGKEKNGRGMPIVNFMFKKNPLIAVSGGIVAKGMLRGGMIAAYRAPRRFD